MPAIANHVLFHRLRIMFCADPLLVAERRPTACARFAGPGSGAPCSEPGWGNGPLFGSDLPVPRSGAGVKARQFPCPRTPGCFVASVLCCQCWSCIEWGLLVPGWVRKLCPPAGCCADCGIRRRIGGTLPPTGARRAGDGAAAVGDGRAGQPGDGADQGRPARPPVGNRNVAASGPHGRDDHRPREDTHVGKFTEPGMLNAWPIRSTACGPTLP